MGRVNFIVLSLTLAALATGCQSKPAVDGKAPAMPEIEFQSELKMTSMRVQSYGANGLEWELAAPFGEMFSRRNTMRVKQLTVQLFEQGNKSTDISANQGVMSTGLASSNSSPVAQNFFGVKLEPGDMHMSGNVVMISTDGSKLTTDWAHYHKKTDMISSTAPVKVERHDSITYGVGMDATADMSRVHIYNETLVIPEQKKL